MDIKKIGVIGAGQMGSGIAEVGLTSGLEVLLRDVTQEALEKGRMRITMNLDKRVEKGKMAVEEKERCLQRLSTTIEMAPFRDCDFVIEAAKFLVYQAAWLADQGFENTKQAAMAKAFASDVAMKVTTMPFHQPHLCQAASQGDREPTFGRGDLSFPPFSFFSGRILCPMDH